jgi:hypothetical protein
VLLKSIPIDAFSRVYPKNYPCFSVENSFLGPRLGI